MKKVLITKTCKGSINGVDIIEFTPSNVPIELPDSLAEAFVDHMKTARYSDEKLSVGPSITNDVKQQDIANQEGNPPILNSEEKATNDNLIPEPNVESDAEPDPSSLEDMNWQAIRKMVIEKGGSWTNKSDGIKFLRGE